MPSHVNQRCLCTLLPLVPCSLIYERDVMRANGGQKRSISVLTIVDTFGRVNRWCSFLKTVPEYTPDNVPVGSDRQVPKTTASSAVDR